MTDRFTGERVVPDERGTFEEEIIYQRHLAAYRFARENLPKGSRVLDVGCGEAYGTALLSAGGSWVAGADVDPAVLRRARRRWPSVAAFVLFDGRSIPACDSSFDALVCFQVVEHVEDDARAAAELARVLRTDGLALVTTPNRLLRLSPGERPWNRFHVREYDPDALGQLLGRFFRQVRIAGIDASEAVRRFELARLRRVRRVVRLDPLGLRHRLPERVNRGARRLLRRLLASRERPAEDGPPSAAAASFEVRPDRPEDALDLLAVCRR